MSLERCEGCCGMGYKGRWRMTSKGKKWKIETHRACRGTGSVEPKARILKFRENPTGGRS